MSDAPSVADLGVNADRSLPGTGPAEVFRYDGFDFDGSELICRYDLDGTRFEEQVRFATTPGAEADDATVQAAARLVSLLAGVSYYKAGAPPVIEVSDGLTAAERTLLEALYLDGLAEFAYVNDLDLSTVVIEAPEIAAPDTRTRPSDGLRPLVPFGGGIDSIVTVEGVRPTTNDLALFVASRDDARFDAIERPAAITGLPVVRADRRIDDRILRSKELGYLNGHVPVTGVLSAVAVLAAALEGRNAVVMSNEWSASQPNTERHGRAVNHQWSKSLWFEDAFRAVVDERVGSVDYFSWIRARSELWVARRFADHTGYHRQFHSCNRAFHIDPARRQERWCGRCDKCCFIDLILAPYVPAAELARVFDGREPLDDPTLVPQMQALAGLSASLKPFECVGDVEECRVALSLAAERPDRADNAALAALAREAESVDARPVAGRAADLLQPLGPDRTPEAYAPRDQLG